MRKFVKKELIGIIRQLDKANEVLMKNANTLSAEQAVNVLTECQQSAIAVGSKVDEIEGEGTATVTFLEEYCEDLYSLSIHWGDVKLTSKTGKHIRLLLNKIGNSIQYDLPDSKKEVVFLPYKASMWDSLESVWMAARDDESCDAYVIPIPYFDKNPDGTFREAHYEGELYPDYVPVTHYNEYDFKTHHPDVIFIHNPYDEWNHVTSVHPFFYSKNLKQFTEQLVYIPYFVLAEVDPEDTEAIEKMQHFCTVPGVFNADKVIVQSEDMKKVYVNVLSEFTAEAGQGKKYWEEKILGIGSPKMDKVANTKIDEEQIPEEWMRIIRKPDGSYKKIIFYNTSVNALLKHEDKMLEKMQDVFRVFKENADEVALLWRPHPLIKATIESMRPELEKAYEEMVRRYLDEGWGIYDDSPDLNRAIAISDAYYGDGSSIVQLYQETGKPVMMQNVEILE